MVTREWRSNCRFSVWAHTRGGRGMQLSGFNNCSLLLYKLDEWFRLSHSLLLQNIHCASSKWIHSIVKPPASRYWQNLKRKLWEELYEHVSDWLSNWYHSISNDFDVWWHSYFFLGYYPSRWLFTSCERSLLKT